jgi:8-oxo-dGTP pyrophosphatase MutT (NUDIX family)
VPRRQYFHDPDAPVARALLAAAFAVVHDGPGRVLLVRRADDGLWELPGGRIDVGETVSAAAIREVAEETGLQVRVESLVGVYSDPAHRLAYPGEGVYQQLAICLRARPRDEQPLRPGADEIAEARWFPPPATAELAMHPTMRVRLSDALRRPPAVTLA